MDFTHARYPKDRKSPSDSCSVADKKESSSVALSFSSMAIVHGAPPFISSSLSQSSCLPSFKLQHPFLFSPSFAFSFNSKRLHFHGLHVRASANAMASAVSGNGNGAVLSPERNPDVTSYGRQYFPLAAVVGQVLPCALFFQDKQCFFLLILHFLMEKDYGFWSFVFLRKWLNFLNFLWSFDYQRICYLILCFNVMVWYYLFNGLAWLNYFPTRWTSGIMRMKDILNFRECS